MLYLAKINGDEAVKSCKVVGNGEIFGYDLVNTYFVDNTGLGDNSESALTFKSFLSEVKVDFYYGIKEVGLFQVYIGEYKKVSRAKIFKDLNILSSKMISKSCRVIKNKNGDLTIKLYSTDILKIINGKIVLNSGNYRTVTTKNRINQFLPIGLYVYQKNYQWYIKDNRSGNTTIKIIEFFDGIEL